MSTRDFLSLPAELRNGIYKEYILDAFSYIAPKKYADTAHLPIPFFSSMGGLPSNGLTFLQVCKQINHEATPILYEVVMFMANLDCFYDHGHPEYTYETNPAVLSRFRFLGNLTYHANNVHFDDAEAYLMKLKDAIIQRLADHRAPVPLALDSVTVSGMCTSRDAERYAVQNHRVMGIFEGVRGIDIAKPTPVTCFWDSSHINSMLELLNRNIENR